MDFLKMFGLSNFFGQSAKNERAKAKLHKPQFAHLFDETPDEWVSLDLEMTGLNPKVHHILSVGAVKISKQNNHLTIDTANPLSIICKPPTMPTTDSIIIHGLRPIDVENGVSYDEMLDQLLNFIGGRPLVGFCVNMDVAFLNQLANPYLGVDLPNRLLDVSTIEQRIRQAKNRNPDMVIEKKHLNTLLDEYAIPRLPAHDSLNDAMMTAMLFCHLQRVQERLSK